MRRNKNRPEKAIRIWWSQRQRMSGTHQVRSLKEARAYDAKHGLPFRYKGIYWGHAEQCQAAAAGVASPARCAVQRPSLKKQLAQAINVDHRCARLHRWSKNHFSLFVRTGKVWQRWSVSIRRRSIIMEEAVC